ncbi:oxysterol-binding protein-related protein 8-like [Planoprotostelium fungivorum]|uniref:Oxysterol-binding protein-related protein 8-like n=1 Tax=Planoprotostelium fungivorum TaxID=1890364 RepID=A0A2P6NTE6_9EUKA|nr:oxysterol-binding protein-related protein 8-like [Planoprotostelium fungivorum]
MGFFLFFFVWLLGVVSGLAGLYFGAVFVIKHKISVVESLVHPSNPDNNVYLAPPDDSDSLDKKDASRMNNSSSTDSEPLPTSEAPPEALAALAAIPLDGPLAEKKKKDLRVTDPLAAAIRNRRRGGGSVNQIDETYRSGWLKIRGSLNVWWNRWVVLKPGKLIYYQSEKKEDCFGIVVLNECAIEQKVVDKKGFCFMLYHPHKKTIYSDKGLKGETLKSAKFPGNSSECIIRASDEGDGQLWMDLIQKAIQSSNDVAMTTISESSAPSPLASSTSVPSYRHSSFIPGGLPRDEDISGKISVGMMPPPLPPKPSVMSDSQKISTPAPSEVPTEMKRSNSAGSLQTKSSFTEEETEEPILHPISSTLSLSGNLSDTDHDDLTSSVTTDKTFEDEDLMSSKNSFTAPALPQQSSSIPVPIMPDRVHASATAKSAPPTPVKPSSAPVASAPPSAPPPPTLLRDATVVTATLPDTTATVNVVVPTTIVEIPGDYPISQSVPHPRKEGWLEAKTLKGWRSFFFTLRSGLLTFFDNDKQAIDCVGLVDLEDCSVHSVGENGFQILSNHRRGNVFIANTTDPIEGGIGQNSFVCGISLRTEDKNDNSNLVQEWIRLIEEEIPKCKRSSPLLLPRIPVFQGEKCHWFNLALSQIFQKHLQPSTGLQFKFKAVLMKKFSRIKKPDYLGEINIEDIHLGDDMFHFGEVSCIRTEHGELVGEADVVYNGKFHLKLSTHLQMLGVTVPVNISVRLEHLSGRALLYTSTEVSSRFTISFIELPSMRFDVQLQVGQRTRLDINKFFSPAADFLQTMLKKLMYRNTVAPNRVTFTLPVPGKKFSVNTIQLTSRSKPVKNQANAGETQGEEKQPANG